MDRNFIVWQIAEFLCFQASSHGVRLAKNHPLAASWAACYLIETRSQ